MDNEQAYTLALISTDREDFTEWKIRHVFTEVGRVLPSPPDPERFLRHAVRRKKNGLGLPKNCTCLHCGYQWTRRKRTRPKACPECSNRRWDKPGHGTRIVLGQ